MATKVVEFARHSYEEKKRSLWEKDSISGFFKENPSLFFRFLVG